MSPWEALVLGAVQGLTEFFPVSSSGHLVLAERLLGLSLPGVAFDVGLHVATLISVLIVYRIRLLGLLRELRSKATWIFVGRIVIATLPAVIVGVALKDWFEARFDDPRFAGTMLLVTGSIVWSSRWTAARPVLWWPESVPLLFGAATSVLAGTAVPFLAVLVVQASIFVVSRLTAPHETEREPGWGSALAMGIAQAVAILPGISRSGSTVVAGLWRRVDPVAAAEFSFLMSIPAILGAAVLSLPDLAGEGAVGMDATALIPGALAAGVCGVIAIRFFVAMLRRRVFWGFAIYCWFTGALYLLTTNGTDLVR
jgi:undecaprenyl-diphosphatase